MEAKATLNYTRISPRKVGIVLDLIRNKPVDLAAAILKHTPKACLLYTSGGQRGADHAAADAHPGILPGRAEKDPL